MENKNTIVLEEAIALVENKKIYELREILLEAEAADIAVLLIYLEREKH